jgi:hypothetical protein
MSAPAEKKLTMELKTFNDVKNLMADNPHCHMELFSKNAANGHGTTIPWTLSIYDCGTQGVLSYGELQLLKFLYKEDTNPDNLQIHPADHTACIFYNNFISVPLKRKLNSEVKVSNWDLIVAVLGGEDLENLM